MKGRPIVSWTWVTIEIIERALSSLVWLFDTECQHFRGRYKNKWQHKIQDQWTFTALKSSDLILVWMSCNVVQMFDTSLQMNGHEILYGYRYMQTFEVISFCRNLYTFFWFPGVRWDWVNLVRRTLIGLLCQPRMVGEHWTFGGMKIGRGNRSTQRKLAALSLCPP
jgi:hypothetical protein